MGFRRSEKWSSIPAHNVSKYILDTNCYIHASRDVAARAALARFVSDAAPWLYVSSIVLAELRAGARKARTRGLVDAMLVEPFLRSERVVTPGPRAWAALGETLARLRKTEGLSLPQVGRSFAFDVLLAYSCREIGAVLVTANTKDMQRIKRVFPFGFVAPYPRARDGRTARREP